MRVFRYDYSVYSTIVIVPLIVAGCTNTGASRENLNREISITYASVIAVDQVELKSDVGKSAAVGGLWGLAINSGGNRNDMIGGALFGAALSGATKKIEEGSNQAFSYLLKGKDSKEFKILTEQGDIEPNDCVSVESGEHTNIRRVSAVYCQNESIQTHVDKAIHSEVVEDANKCQQAKEQLLEAGKDELEAQVRKVQALCND